jgi:hypothetical protein
MRHATIAAPAAVLVIALAAAPASATNGYFSHGYGTHYKGMAGAGAATPTAGSRSRRARSSSTSWPRGHGAAPQRGLLEGDQGHGLQSIGLEMDQWDFELGWSFGIRK